MSLFPLFKEDTPAPISKGVAQHNDLIFAPFYLDTLESRIFISMLEKIDKDMEEFEKWRIPVKEIIPNLSGEDYEALRRACVKLVETSINLADPSGRHVKGKKDWRIHSLVSTCSHRNGSGYIECKFSDDVKDYLLKLRGNFTTADLKVLKNFKDFRSVAVYWMLKSLFFRSAVAVILVEEFRNKLLPKDFGGYKNPSQFKYHILDKIVKPEIDQTDCAFEWGKPVKEGRKVVSWTFIRKEVLPVLDTAPSLNLSPKLHMCLEGLSIDQKGIQTIAHLLGQEVKGVLIEEKYVWFVIYHKKIAQQDGKIKKSIGGAVIDALAHHRLLATYKKQIAQNTDMQQFIPRHVEKIIPFEQLWTEFTNLTDADRKELKISGLHGYMEYLVRNNPGFRIGESVEKKPIILIED